MRRGTLVLVGVLGAAAVLASVIVPRARDLRGPSPIDVAVPIVLIGCSLLLAQRNRRWVAALLGGSGVVWCVIGVASAMPGRVADGLLRLGVVPLALVVVAVGALPGGTRAATRLVAVLAGGVAVFGGVGGTTHIRLLLGVLMVLVAAHRLAASGFGELAHSRLAGVAVLLQTVFGVALALLDPIVSASIIGPVAAANSVAVAMAAASVGVVRILDPGLLARGTKRLAGTSSDRLPVESWLGELLGAPLLRVAYPTPAGVRVLENGEISLSPAGVPVASREGQVVAWLDPDLVIDPGLSAGLSRLLATVGASAQLRAAQKERSAELERSRARLAEAALGESVALESRLSVSVLPYLDAIEDRASLLPDPDGIRARVDAARAQVLSISRGLAPVSGGGLAAALGGLASLAPDLVTVEVSRLQVAASTLVPDMSEATAMWFAASEAVANALKHSGGSMVSVYATGPCAVEVSDSGSGGADALGSGLAGISDRLAAVGGRLVVSSNRRGTRVSITVPGRLRADAYPDVGLVATTAPTLGSYGD